MTTIQLFNLWTEARTRLIKLLPQITEADLPKQLLPAPNSIGFLLRHIGDVELLFAKNVFGNSEVKVTAKTVIAQRDTGEWVNLEELKVYIELSASVLGGTIKKIPDEDWSKTVTTKEFGTKTLAEAMGRIVSHTAYHAGQIAVILKYAR